MAGYFRCPKCGKRHAKTYQYGAVRGQSGNMVARETFHPDVVCTCGAEISGREIVGGMHDPGPVTISAAARVAMGSVANALGWGGITYIFASASTAVIVGLAAFVLIWLGYLSGAFKTEPYTWR